MPGLHWTTGQLQEQSLSFRTASTARLVPDDAPAGHADPGCVCVRVRACVPAQASLDLQPQQLQTCISENGPAHRLEQCSIVGRRCGGGGGRALFTVGGGSEEKPCTASSLPMCLQDVCPLHLGELTGREGGGCCSWAGRSSPKPPVGAARCVPLSGLLENNCTMQVSSKVSLTDSQSYARLLRS